MTGWCLREDCCLGCPFKSQQPLQSDHACSACGAPHPDALFQDVGQETDPAMVPASRPRLLPRLRGEVQLPRSACQLHGQVPNLDAVGAHQAERCCLHLAQAARPTGAVVLQRHLEPLAQQVQQNAEDFLGRLCSPRVGFGRGLSFRTRRASRAWQAASQAAAQTPRARSAPCVSAPRRAPPTSGLSSGSLKQNVATLPIILSLVPGRPWRHRCITATAFCAECGAWCTKPVLRSRRPGALRFTRPGQTISLSCVHPLPTTPPHTHKKAATHTPTHGSHGALGVDCVGRQVIPQPTMRPVCGQDEGHGA